MSALMGSIDLNGVVLLSFSIVINGALVLMRATILNTAPLLFGLEVRFLVWRIVGVLVLSSILG